MIVLLYLAYLLLDAWQDGQLFRRGCYINHRVNWYMRAIAGLAVMINLFGITWDLVIWTPLFISASWLVFDIAINCMRGRDTFKYVGSGGADLWFKKIFPIKTWVPMIITKTILIGLSILLIYWLS